MSTSTQQPASRQDGISEPVKEKPYFTGLTLEIRPNPKDEHGQDIFEIKASPYGWRGGRYLSMSCLCDKADAHILHAAPEMYEALSAIMNNEDLSRNDWPEETMFVLRRAQAAIARAEGRAE